MMQTLAQRLGQALQAGVGTLVIAESCTGGGIAAAVTAIPGSSAWFERGFVPYSNLAKTQQLGVPATLLETHGAVSEPVVRALVRGALERSPAGFAVAVSGIAGPGGGSTGKPVGTVWLAWARRDGPEFAEVRHFPGDRAAVRQATVDCALQGLLRLAGGAE